MPDNDDRAMLERDNGYPNEVQLWRGSLSGKLHIVTGENGPGEAEDAGAVYYDRRAAAPPAPGQNTDEREALRTMPAKEWFEGQPPDWTVKHYETIRRSLSASRASTAGDGAEDGHDSDCSTHNMPAYLKGPCDCGQDKSSVPLVTWDDINALLAMVKELVDARELATGGEWEINNRSQNAIRQKTTERGIAHTGGYSSNNSSEQWDVENRNNASFIVLAANIAARMASLPLNNAVVYDKTPNTSDNGISHLQTVHNARDGDRVALAEALIDISNELQGYLDDRGDTSHHLLRHFKTLSNARRILGKQP